jgi:glycosyltransferase involved in cell wall biosynthesis
MRIVLADWGNGGHHPTWFQHFVLALEELGVDVLALCPYPAEAEAGANEARPKAEIANRPRGKTEFARVKVASRRFGSPWPRRLSLIDWAIRHFRGVESQAHAWSKRSGKKVDAIFYACMYDFDFQRVQAAQPFLRLPWIGLYLHVAGYRQPRRHPEWPPRPEKLFSTGLCKGIFVLDEGIVDQVSKAIGKPVVALPELNDGRMPVNDQQRSLGDRLAEFAAGRPVVGLFGMLKESKGVIPFLEAARKSVGKPVCFALAGELYWPGPEKNWICETLAECPNVWNHLLRIPTEIQLNYLLSKCEAIYAAYLDFPHSSGILSKAAALKKPVIVSEGYLMAERVRHFKLGEIISEGKVPALLDAINAITKDPAAWQAANQPQWREYCEAQSFTRLKSSFQKLLAVL